jgi:tRNA-specific 2-thiouridylase
MENHVQTVAVAMSGGVDSSVAALLLKQQGYDVIGVHLKLFDTPPDKETCVRSCCSEESSIRARSVCAYLDIPFYVLNYCDKFEEHVIKPFARAYLEGRTPNPCIACNHRIKFDILISQMRATGMDLVATGHYIRKIRNLDRWELFRGKDQIKDQTYFLYMLTQEILEHSLFPLGDYQKSEIRKIASDHNLVVAEQPESQEICFALTDSYSDIIRSMFPGQIHDGPIINRSGKILGTHKGIINYTIGQRRGLGIAAPDPLYVLEIRPQDNVIVVGPKQDVFSDGLIFSDESWVSGERPKVKSHVEVQIRYNASPKPAVFEGEIEIDCDVEIDCEPEIKGKTKIECDVEIERKTKKSLRITFESPQPAVTPGQAVVLYEGDKLLGGGVIVESTYNKVNY